VIEVAGARVWIADGPTILDGIDWRVHPGEHWAMLGPNGSGKSTLLALVGATRHPSEGSVAVLGARLGEASLWELRERIGVVDPALPLYEWMTVLEVVLTGASGTIRPRWECYGTEELQRARELLELLGCEAMSERSIARCSQGERQRVRIARALMPDPPLLLLDEPATGLDLPAREALILALAGLAAARPDLATVVVSHHVEELPPTTTHALLLRAGGVVASGPAVPTLTSDNVTRCYGFPVEMRHDGGRWTARASGGWRLLS
jgi:iron complex transport system ATP-binding protein